MLTAEPRRQAATKGGRLIRLRYAALLVLALGAIIIGTYPSILTVGAILAVPLAIVGFAGVVAPGIIEQRRSIRRLAVAGIWFLGLEALAVLGWGTWTSRRPVTLVVQPPLPPLVRIIYNVEDGAPRRLSSWGRTYHVPPSGIVYTKYSFDKGHYRTGNPHPLRVSVNPADPGQDIMIGAWVAGGHTQSGPCTLAYDDFSLRDGGEADAAPSDVRAKTWLDSLDMWGVECRGGRLYRAGAGRAPRLPRTGPACSYERGGGVTCNYDHVP